MNEFTYNVINKAAASLRKLKVAGKLSPFEAVVLSDEHPISYMLCGTLLELSGKVPRFPVSLVENGNNCYRKLLDELLEKWPNLRVYPSLEAYLQQRGDLPQMIFDPVNLRSPIYTDPSYKEARIRRTEQMLEDCRACPQNQYQLITCIPAITIPLPDVTNAIAEREYEVIFRNKTADSLEKYVLRLEDCIRSHQDVLPRTQVLRLDRVYGPGIPENDGAWIYDVLQDVFSRHIVTAYDRDRHNAFSAAYVKDALVGILLAMLNGRKGNIYHITSHKITRFQAICHLLSAFPENQCALETVHEGWQDHRPTHYHMLNGRKLRLTHASKLDKLLSTSVADALSETARWYLGTEGYIPNNDVNVYYGRMPRIRELELDILKEVDAICKEHDIPYFLTAGTMLGAVRHKGFIPWDDDVDIGMLPEDYFRFLQVCPSHLCADYGYQNFGTEPASHYIHDKIRLKNSFFSTKYSNQYAMMNGVYIDIFVYFKTSDRPAIQKFHLWYIHALRRVIGLRWADRPRKHLHYRLSKIALPVLRLFPFLWLHKYYLHVLGWFEKSRSHYRVDSMGFNLKKVGAVPDEWFHGTVDAEFCGRTYPILAHYDDFLRHWYGPAYMDLLPVSKRKSVHDVVRIDLGQALFPETMHDDSFRNVDLRGELYETNN